MRSPIRCATICLTAALFAACNGSDVIIGSAHVSVATSGEDIDRDGYELVVDSGVVRSLAANGSFDVEHLPSGMHIVELRGVGPNCAVTGGNTQIVSIATSEPLDISFTVTCVATGVWVFVGTTGLDPDSNGFTVAIDSLAPVNIGLNDSVRVTYLTSGTHVVQLGDIAGNCGTSSANPQSVAIQFGQVGAAHFAVTCRAASGVVAVSAATTGLDLDTNGYLVQLDGAVGQPLPANGLLVFRGVGGGTHSLTLTGTSANCAATAGTTQSVSVTIGGAVRDTARTSFAVACSAVTGVLLLSATTTGVDADANGYAVYLDGGARWTLPSNGSVAIPDVAGGSHAVSLSSASANCSASGGNGRSISVSVGGATRDTVRIAFAISCVAITGSVRITTATTGSDLDPNGYTVYVDYGLMTSQVLDSGVVVIDGLSAGNHSLFLAGLDPNCTLNGANLRTVTVTTGGLTRDTVATSYAVTCQATSGTIQVTTSTSGSDLDNDGYTLHLVGLNYDQVQSVAPSGVASFARVPPGAYFVAISGLAMNCQAGGPVTHSGSIAAGDTVAVGFGVSCQLSPELAVSHSDLGNADLYTVRANGTIENRLTVAPGTDGQPSWTIGGGRIAFMSTRGGSAQIYVMNGDGTGQVPLTNAPGISNYPTWSPDGSHIAFAGVRGGVENIYVMADNGSNAVPITTGGATLPAWSPDGLRIAFISSAGGQPNLFVMNADGSGRVRLSAAPYPEKSPDWSPDGTSIVVSRQISCDYYYGCQSDLVVINADGSGEHRLTSGGDLSSPRWSPDGHWVAFAETVCDYYSCSSSNVQIVSSDGANRMFVLTEAWDPAWRR